MRSCFILLLGGVVAVPCAAFGADAADQPILSTLRSGHPRLMVLDSELARVRELIDSNEDPRQVRDELREQATGMLAEPPIEHKLVGPRLLSQSRRCLTRVSTLAALYRLEGDRRFAERAEKEMLTAARFPDWNPRHFLDTAEMTNALGIGYDWLYDVLSPESRESIRTAIVELGLKPGLKVYRNGEWWARSRHNWNQVCNGGMTVGALAIADEEPQLAAEIISHARKSILLAMSTLAPDGGWPEGPGYWNYAMRYAAYYWSALQTALGDDFGLKSLPGFAETGLFRIHCIGPTQLNFNFADCGAGPGNAFQMLYFARRFDRPVYAAHHRRFRSSPSAFDLLWYDPRGGPGDIAALPTAAWFHGVDVVTLRSEWDDPHAVFVGFKGGDNAANHSNLDLGTFVLDALGQRWAVELGADDYNLPGYFGNKRWTYYRLRTEGQNTLVLNGDNQDSKAKAPIIAFESSPDRALAVADLTAGYAKHARRVRRGVALMNGRQVLVQDEIEVQNPTEVVWGMHTTAAVSARSQDAALTLAGKKLYARILEPADACWTVKQPAPDPPQRPLKGIRKLTIHRSLQPGSTRIAVLFSPAEPPKRMTPPGIQPLADWKRHATR